jgi:hypothetical protein
MRGVGVGGVRTGQVILPILHRLSVAELMTLSPSLVDKLARDTATTDVASIADEIVEVVARATASS